MPSFVLIHPTVWPQYTKVTDRQDRQAYKGLIAQGEPFLQTVAQKVSAQKLLACYMLSHTLLRVEISKRFYIYIRGLFQVSGLIYKETQHNNSD